MTSYINDEGKFTLRRSNVDVTESNQNAILGNAFNRASKSILARSEFRLRAA